MTTIKNVYAAFAAVMAEVRAVEKSDRNQQQGFNFRGIDATIDAVGPALRKHGVFIVPSPVEMKSETYQTSRGTAMRNVTVEMRYTVFGPAGDSFVGGSYGEAADSGDKAVTKAQSVAYRTFLLQGLCVPTGDVDPDAHSHERAASTPKDKALVALRAVCNRKQLDLREVAQRFHGDYAMDIKEADAATIEAFAAVIADE